MKLFKEFGIDLESIAEVPLPMFTEWAYDPNANELLVRDGAYYLVEGNEALQIWIAKALQTKRFSYMAYSKDYGCEIKNAVGLSLDKDIEQSEMERYIEEALLVNPYIKEVRNFLFQTKGSGVHITFEVKSIYGDFVFEERRAV